MGFTRAEIDEASDVIVGRMTIEGAPILKPQHYAVFDCANRCGKIGQRYLPPMSHVRMMAAAQPFLSGAISKTVNLPNESTIEEVAGIYAEGWKLGLKAVALYRDGCKASQPLSTSNTEKEKDSEASLSATTESLAPIPQTSAAQEAVQLSLTALTRPQGVRVRLPKKRKGFTQEARVGGHKVFVRTGEYEDGTLGEIFIDMHKEGAAFRSLMNCFAMSVSLGLQYGVPLNTYVEQFTFTRFEPQGIIEGHPYVKFSTSIVDYIFRALGVEYLRRYDLAHIKPEEVEETDTPASPPSMPPHAFQHAAGGPIAAGGNAGLAPNSDALTRAAAVRSSTMSEGLENAAPNGSPLDAHLDAMMGDAPVCDTCGHITVRNGACYKCLNCGNSMGCS